MIWLTITLSKYAKVSRSLPKNSSETVRNETEIPEKIYLSPEKRLLLMSDDVWCLNYLWYKIDIIIYNGTLKHYKFVK